MGKKHYQASEMITISNPTRGEIKISYNLSAKTKASLKVYNIAGKKVYEANDDKGCFVIKELSAGIYFLRLEASGGYKAARKLIVVQ